MAVAPGPFDVLVIGSGASGLAAALSAERAGAVVGLATKGSLQSCNSAKAQGGIQAALGPDDSPELHAEDVWQMPTIFIGSVAQIREDLQARRERFGLSYLVAPDHDLPTLAAVIAGS